MIVHVSSLQCFPITFLFLLLNNRFKNPSICTGLDASAYELIANFAPKLRSLTLNYCGALKSDVLQYMQERMTNLVRLELYGAFLVKP